LTLYILILIAVGVAVMIYLIVRFYRNLFTDEGYLMNTIPVKPYELILSKLIVSFVWTIVNLVCTMISIFILVLSQSSLPDILEIWNEAFSYFLTEMGMKLSGLIALGIFGGIVSILYMFLMFYTSIAIGQTVRNHKVLFSLAAYVVLYIICQIISSLVLLPFGFFTLVGSTNEFHIAFVPMMWLSYVISAILMVIYFFITNYIMSKKLNLE
jgi:hypothetical protein